VSVWPAADAGVAGRVVFGVAGRFPCGKTAIAGRRRGARIIQFDRRTWPRPPHRLLESGARHEGRART
jgi:hypothetical protein